MNDPQRASGDLPAADRGNGTSMSTRLAEKMANRPKRHAPDPKGKGWAMLGVVVVILIAVVDLIINESGPSKQVRESVEKRTANELLDPSQVRPPSEGEVGTEGAPPPSTSPTGTEPADEEAGPTTDGATLLDLEAIKASTQELTQRIPEGLSDPTLRRLRLNLPPLADPTNALDLSVNAAFDSLVPTLAQCTDGERETVRAFLLGELLRVAKHDRWLRKTLETGTWLLDGAEEGTAQDAVIGLMIVARDRALESNRNAPAALLFLSTQEDGGGPVTHARIQALLLDGARPLHVRKLAAEVLPDHAIRGAVAALRDDANTHPVIRRALER